MKLVETIVEARNEVKKARNNGKTIALVPTMGYLHEGHISLIREARKKHDYVVISIFVNPLQFGPDEDFDRYPRDIERDKKIAIEEGVDLIFHPSVNEMYPTDPPMMIHVSKGVNVLCGINRPQHFDGVATVVMKLFQIVLPDEAFFGQKDAQQVAIIMNMVSTFNLPLKVIPCPTIREEDQLAKSSRNVHLTKKEREEAPLLYETLKYGANLIYSGENNRTNVIKAMTDKLSEGQGAIDYVEILTFPSLEKEDTLKGKLILAVAYEYERARLIDNIVIETS